MKISLLFILGFVSYTQSESCPRINRKFDKAIDKLYSKLVKVIKILNSVKENEQDHPQSCEDVGRQRTLLPQPEVKKLSEEVVGTLPGRYILYEEAGNATGRFSLCF